MTLIVSGVGAVIHLYSVGYMAHDEDYARYFAYMNLFALSMLDTGAGRQPAADVRRLGGRGPVLLPADRVLVRQRAVRLQRAQGFRRQPGRRRRLHPGHPHDCLRARRAWRVDAEFRRAAGASRDARAGGDDGRAVAAARRDRQVGADSALRMAAGRDGRPDPGQRADPCRDDGDRRRLHDRAAAISSTRSRPTRCTWSRSSAP